MIILLTFGAVFGLYFVFDLLTRKYLTHFKLFMILGLKGSGKSTYFAKMMKQYLKKGWNVYFDSPSCRIPGVRIFDANDFGTFVPAPRSVVFFDEAGITFDARKFKTLKDSVRDLFKLQRHYEFIVYLGSQDFDVDVKLRKLCDGLFLQVKKFRVFSVGKRIVRRIGLVDATAEGESRIVDNLEWAPFWTWTWTYIPKYTKDNDSFHAPPKPPLPYRLVGENGIITQPIKPISDSSLLHQAGCSSPVDIDSLLF